jgi:hypothetical protein
MRNQRLQRNSPKAVGSAGQSLAQAAQTGIGPAAPRNETTGPTSEKNAMSARPMSAFASAIASHKHLPSRATENAKQSLAPHEEAAKAGES